MIRNLGQGLAQLRLNVAPRLWLATAWPLLAAIIYINTRQRERSLSPCTSSLPQAQHTRTNPFAGKVNSHYLALTCWPHMAFNKENTAVSVKDASTEP